jgi:hypothetical protein
VALSVALSYVLMTYDCPHCRSPVTKTGLWFKVAGHFRCAQCGQSVRLTYSEKLTLFERYADRLGPTSLTESEESGMACYELPTGMREELSRPEVDRQKQAAKWRQTLPLGPRFKGVLV